MKAFGVVLFATAVFFAGANARPGHGPTHLEKRKRDSSPWRNEFERQYDSDDDGAYQHRDRRPSRLPVVPKVSDFDDSEEREPGWDFEMNANHIRRQPYSYHDQSDSADEDEDHDDYSMDDEDIDDEDYTEEEDDSHMDDESDEDVSEDEDQDQDVDSGSSSAENKGMNLRKKFDGAGVINPRLIDDSDEDQFLIGIAPRRLSLANTPENRRRVSDMCRVMCTESERKRGPRLMQIRELCSCSIYGFVYKK